MKEIKQKEVLSEFIQQTHDPQYTTPVLDVATYTKKGQLWEVMFQEESVGSFNTEKEAQTKVEQLLSEY
tara:strand:+ start:409 stop:615 length:207 start_codon:yes stop_codon:yes gene_type:complete